jgi:uncharacterized protein (TIGR03086 family)
VSQVSERYARLADAFTTKIASVGPDEWANPSPCEGWTARDVVRHVVSTQTMFLGFVGRSVGDAAPSFDDDPLGAWQAARAAVQRDLEDPERAGAEFEGMLGRSTFESAVDRFLCSDLVVHGWDLARSAGLDEHIEPDEISRVRNQAEAFGDALRSPGAFGPAVDPPPGASEQDQLLAFLGRRP